MSIKLSLRKNLREVLVELSPIIAGFKLAVIVISYFGLGSIAKWVISYWYPFTRHIWDSITNALSLPELPVIIKDSLTALIFFLPLGITAIWQKINGKNDNNNSHRILGIIFGFTFLIIICKDVIASVAEYLALSAQSMGGLKAFGELSDGLSGLGIFYACSVVLTFVLLGIARIKTLKESKFSRQVRRFEEHSMRMLAEKQNSLLISSSTAVLVGAVAICLYFAVNLDQELTVPIVIAIMILTIILVNLFLAIFYAPKKLYVTTGAAVAFILAALLFELLVVAKKLMESTAIV